MDSGIPVESHIRKEILSRYYKESRKKHQGTSYMEGYAVDETGTAIHGRCLKPQGTGCYIETDGIAVLYSETAKMRVDRLISTLLVRFHNHHFHFT